MPEVRVLLADDHPVARLGLRVILEQAQDFVIVGEVANGPDALAQCLERAPHVAVLDLKLPGMTAIEVLAALRDARSPTRVVVITGASGIEHPRQARALGAAAFLTKDTPPARLLEAIREVSVSGSSWPREQQTTLEPQSSLSPRELEVLRELCRGGTNKEIAQRLTLSDGTVRIHLSNIFAKLKVDDRTAAVTLALRRGLIELD
jgi:DNA-binding NarL/FixJ family response regulator